jgi:SNF2 family DNA or RNA helicase
MPDRGPYERMKKDMVLNLNGEEITALTAATLSGKLAQMASGFLYNTINVPGENRMVTDTRPMWISSHKFDRLDELLQENQRANTVIVYHFREELAELKRRYPHAIGLDDKNAVEKWNTGKVELLIIPPTAGLNLQLGGSNMVFLSLPWSLELYEQTIGRLHRSGQLHAVWVYILLTEKTIDERIWKALHNKRSISDLAMEELR